MNDRIQGFCWNNPYWYGKWRIYLSREDAFHFGGHEYEFIHDDYDGAPDALDNRCGYGKSIQDCKDQINDMEIL